MYWQCTVRPRRRRCLAAVTERSGTYIRGCHDHNHGARVDARLNVKLHSQIRATAKANLFTSASTIVQEALQGELEMNQPLEAMPTFDALVRWGVFFESSTQKRVFFRSSNLLFPF